MRRFERKMSLRQERMVDTFQRRTLRLVRVGGEDETHDGIEMNSDRTPRKWVTGFSSALLALSLLAGCGSGSDGNRPSPPPPDPEAVASITLPAAHGIAIIGTEKSIPALVKGVNGTTLTDRTISWTSSNTAVMTVGATGATGNATPIATGTAIITATVEGKNATVTLEVKNAPADLAEFKAMFPFIAQDPGGRFTVASDISQGYSDARLEHLQKSWDFFESFFPTKFGDWAEMYYTWDRGIVTDQGGTACPTTVAANRPGRLLRTCVEASTNVSFLVAPDLDTSGAVRVETETALSTLSQVFMDSIQSVKTYTMPWLWEGLSYAFKSGDFEDGPYTMRAMTDPERSTFKQSLTAGTLLPLQESTASGLVDLTRAIGDGGTWAAHAAIAEPQAAMLLNYLYRNDPQMLKDLFAAIDAGTVLTSEEAFNAVLSATGKTVTELETDYKAYGSAL